MYGERGRVGLVVPSSNTTNEPEFSRAPPAGVSLHTARTRLGSVDADSLSAMASDAVAYGCTTGSLVHDIP